MANPEPVSAEYRIHRVRYHRLSSLGAVKLVLL